MRTVPTAAVAALLLLVVFAAGIGATGAASAPPGVKLASCSVYLVSAGAMVTFSTYDASNPPGSPGQGMSALCAAEAKDMTTDNVGSPFRWRNRWTTRPQKAARQLVCLFHEAWVGSVLTVTVRDVSPIVINGDTFTYLVPTRAITPHRRAGDPD